MEVRTGVFGATVSTVTLSAPDAELTLPATSIALAVKAWLPSASVAVANDHAPLPLAVAVPIWVAPSNTCTVLPAAAVPVKVSVLSLVMPSPTTPLSVENDVTVGAPGATVSIVTLSAVEAVLTLPAVSTALEVKAWLPSAGVAVANDQAPLPLAVTVPIWLTPSHTCTVLPAAAVPVSTSVLSLVIPSPTTPLSVENVAIVGAPRAAVSIVT